MSLTDAASAYPEALYPPGTRITGLVRLGDLVHELLSERPRRIVNGLERRLGLGHEGINAGRADELDVLRRSVHSGERVQGDHLRIGD